MSEASHTEELELKRMLNETRLPAIDLEARVLERTNRLGSMRTVSARRRGRWVAVACSITALAVLLGALSSFPASAEQLRKLPIVGKWLGGNILSFAGDSGLVGGRNAGLSTEVNAEATDQGVTIKLQDAIYDGARLSISFEIDSEKSDHLQFLSDIQVGVNGGPLSYAPSQSHPRIVDARKAIGILTLDLGDMQWAERFDLELRIGEVASLGDGDAAASRRVAGEWTFKLPVVNRALENSRHRALAAGESSAVSQDGQRQFQVTDYLITPVTTKIGYRFAGKGANDWLLFQLRDDRGMVVDWLSGSSDSVSEGTDVGTGDFAPLPAGTKEISVTPYYLLSDPDREPVKVPLTSGLPIVIPQRAGQQLIVHQAEFLADKTVIRYEVKGDNPQMQANLWLETADGQLASPSRTQTRADDPSSYSYVVEYPPLDPQQSYRLCTLPPSEIRLFDDLTVKVKVEE